MIATGESHSVRECCQIAFDEAGLGDYEAYIDDRPRTSCARLSPITCRQTASKAERVLGWEPTDRASSS